MIETELREHWWAVVAAVTGLTRDLAAAQDAAQDACVAALVQWPASGVPGNPRAWLISTARHKALDRIRREAARPVKEEAAMREIGQPGPPPSNGAASGGTASGGTASAGTAAAWMHVSAGLGTSPFTPVRFACRPEASLLTLVGRDGLA